jgi:YbbR domain-containing protein
VKDLALKIFSLGIALVLWYLVTTNSQTVVLKVPFELSNLPSDRILLSNYESQVEVKVRGPSFLVSSLASHPPSFRKRIQGEIANRYTLSLRPSDLDLPEAVEVISVEPNQIELIFEKRVTKNVTVEIPLLGNLEGLKIDDIQVSPKEVTVSGPQSEVRSLQRVEGYPIDLREIRDEAKRSVGTLPAGKHCEVSPDQVQVRIRVSPLEVTKKFDKLPIEVRAIDGGNYTVRPSTTNVHVKGSKSVMEGLKTDNVVPFVRVTSLSDKTEKLSIQVELPKGVSLISSEPPEVSVKAGALKKGGTKP